MVERIRQLLDVRKLTPTQFADAIGIARPIVSHILSGRNKPSLDVVQRIAAAFPELSLPWLLSGLGAMTTVGSAPAEPVIVPAEPATEPTAARPAEVRTPPVRRAPLPRPESSSPAALPLPSPTAPEPAAEPAAAAAVAIKPATAAPVVPASPAPAPAAVVPTASGTPPTPPNPDLALAAAFGEPGKAIRRIVIFYHDGTFTAYQPE